MKKFWNTMYYFTFILGNKVGYKYIGKPILSFIGLFVSKNRHNNSLKSLKKETNSFTGVMIGQAYAAMFFTCLVIHTLIAYLAAVIFEFSYGSNLKYAFIGVCLSSYLINYFLLSKDDVYLKYFKQFEKEESLKGKFYQVAIFHFVPLLILCISVYIWR